MVSTIASRNSLVAAGGQTRRRSPPASGQRAGRSGQRDGSSERAAGLLLFTLRCQGSRGKADNSVNGKAVDSRIGKELSLAKERDRSGSARPLRPGPGREHSGGFSGSP